MHPSFWVIESKCPLETITTLSQGWLCAFPEPTPQRQVSYQRSGEQAFNGCAACVLRFDCSWSVGNGPETAPLVLARKFPSARGGFSSF